jgi:hypothetical protein
MTEVGMDGKSVDDNIDLKDLGKPSIPDVVYPCRRE